MRNLLLLVLVVFCCLSCSPTRRVPSGHYLLTKNKIEVLSEDNTLSKKERIAPSSLERFVKQEPNKKLLGTNFYLWVYNAANPNKNVNTWWNRLKRRIGEAPVLLDTALTARSADAMKVYLAGKGFLRSETSFAVDTARKRAAVTYVVRQGDPYRIGKVSYDFRDDFLRPLILGDSAQSLLHSGTIFDTGILESERVRIADLLKNKGYYNFSINNISYVADTTVGNRLVDVRMVVRRYLSGYNAEGDPQLENSRVYRIKDVYIYPNYDPTAAASDSAYMRRLDTLYYRGLNIVYDAKQGVRSEILRQTINLYPNNLYSASEVKRTYDNIMRLGYYKSASILFTEVADNTAGDNLITYIDASQPLPLADSTSYTTEGYLACNILCTPALKQSYTIDLEGTTSSNFYGLTGQVGYQNRNLFRGVELLDVSVRGGYEFIRAKGKKNSFEIGVTASMSFPRFIFPIRLDKFNRLNNPRTKVEISYNEQRRPYYHRTLSSAVWGYSWSNRKNSSFVIKPIDISVVKLSYIDNDFLESLGNPYLRNSYKSQLIAGLSGSYILNTSRTNSYKNSISLRVNGETNGNLIDGLSHWWSKPAGGKDYYHLFGIQYAQYARLDANFAVKFPMGTKSSLVYRLYAGGGLAYGNSTSIPFERLFFCGGSNSMRGWLARTLGPGNSPISNSLYPSQLGDFKLETNLEGRFPIWGIVHGAVFLDVGNIWFLRAQEVAPESVFHFNSFFEQLGMNTGLGVRLDLNFFVFRLDWGIKLHNPNKPVGERWIHNFKLYNTALNFGIGYPF